MIVWDPIAPGENLQSGINWAPRLGNDQVATSNWSASTPAGLVLTFPTISVDKTLTYIWVANAVLGTVYQLTNSITTVGGQSETETVQFVCANKSVTTWSYNPSLLSTSQKDQVRLLIGDTYSGDPQLQDDEINFALTQRSNIYGAAADCCRALASKYSRSVDTAAGNSKKAFSQLSRQYTIKASEYEQKATMNGGGLPYAGGISIADKLNQEQNDDRVRPQFNVGMDDNFLPVPPAGNETESQV